MADLLEGYSKWSETTNVCLFYAAPCLIVPARTGVRYYNQTGCVCCNQHEIEGFALPIKARFAEFFNGFCLHEYNASGKQALFEEALEELCASVGLNYRGHDFEEAWTTIQVNQGGGKYTDGTDFEIILSWENCD
jgi:hypothetical protein